ncbi:hypothetical protein F5Y08DRAFT_349020 [Xylaria arbuscula]|nr:hypothetical protein F5Y08DRAFT_349020 [Xylaria arbuscula]
MPEITRSASPLPSPPITPQKTSKIVLKKGWKCKCDSSTNEGETDCSSLRGSPINTPTKSSVKSKSTKSTSGKKKDDKMADPRRVAASNSIHKVAALLVDAEITLRAIVLQAHIDKSDPLNEPGAADSGEGVPAADVAMLDDGSAVIEHNFSLQKKFESQFDLQGSLESGTGTEHFAAVADAVAEIREKVLEVQYKKELKDRERRHEASRRFKKNGKRKSQGLRIGKTMGKKSPLCQVWNAEDVTVKDRLEAGGEVSWDEYAEHMKTEEDNSEG